MKQWQLMHPKRNFLSPVAPTGAFGCLFPLLLSRYSPLPPPDRAKNLCSESKIGPSIFTLIGVSSSVVKNRSITSPQNEIGL